MFDVFGRLLSLLSGERKAFSTPEDAATRLFLHFLNDFRGAIKCYRFAVRGVLGGYCSLGKTKLPRLQALVCRGPRQRRRRRTVEERKLLAYRLENRFPPMARPVKPPPQLCGIIPRACRHRFWDSVCSEAHDGPSALPSDHAAAQ